MRITRKIRPTVEVSELVDQNPLSTSHIVRLGTIAELVTGRIHGAIDDVMRTHRN
jgi:hypothetical protein